MSGGKGSQSKGREAELALAKELRERLGIPGIRAGKPASFGREADIVGVPGLHIEVKRHERLALPEWIEQSERDSVRLNDGFPTVIFRRNREPWRICLRLDHFLRIYKCALGGNKNGKT